jgi:hypothetical protein
MAISQSTGTFGSAPKGISDNLYTLSDPTKYTSLYDFIKEVNAPDVRAQLTKTFGAQGISGFLQMTGAIKNNGTADSVQFFEEARLHQVQRATVVSSLEDDNSTTDSSGALGDITGGVTFGTVVAADASGFSDGSSVQLIVREGDIILVNGVDRMIVVGSNAAGAAITSSSTTFHAKPIVGGTATVTITVADVLDMPIIGNMFNQGTDQPTRFIESNVVKRTNPYAIVKESYEVSGSQATNIGYIDVGGGDYRYYVKGEMDTRQRFMDKREMIMLLGQKATNSDADAGLPKVNSGGFDANVEGTEGYLSALEDRGIVSSTLIGQAGLSDLDLLIRELDKNGAPAEYAVYSNTQQDLLLDDMIGGAGAGGNVTAGVASSYGAFNNDRDMALNLGFKSYSRGGYTFHKNSFKLLNDPTLLGNTDVANRLCAGVMIPLANVVDPRSGERAPSLEMNYKAAGGYSREMEHWVTGGGVLGFTNDTQDVAKFHYRSECCLVTRAANQHVLIQGS